MNKRFSRIATTLAVALTLALSAFAQETSTKGNLAGVVADKTGAVVVGAKVTMTGPTGTRATDTDKDGRFLFSTLDPGAYNLKIEKTGFSAAQLRSLGVVVGKTATVSITLEPGASRLPASCGCDHRDCRSKRLRSCGGHYFHGDQH